MIFLKYITA